MSSPRLVSWPAWQAGLHDEMLRTLLREDAPHGDLTTRALGLGDRPAQIRFQARGDMCLSGIEAAARLLQLCGVDARPLQASGQAVAAGETLLKGQGLAGGVLLGWKAAQTLVEACSGVATATAAIVALLRDAGYSTPLACTRKNFPGTRWLAAQAVEAGGGVMHRLGLSETLLVFPEHRALMKSDEWPQRLAALRQSQPEKCVVVEVGTVADALYCAQLAANVLQLERFSPEQLRDLRRQLCDTGLRATLAPAGGVIRANALAYAEAGADLLVSSAPLFAPPADVKVAITLV